MIFKKIKDNIRLILINIIIAVLIGYVSIEKIQTINTYEDKKILALTKERELKSKIEKKRFEKISTFRDYKVRDNLKLLTEIVDYNGDLRLNRLSVHRTGWKYAISGDLESILLFCNTLLTDESINLQYRLEKIKVSENGNAVVQILLIGV